MRFMVNDLVGNGLDDKCYGLVWEKGHVFESFKGESMIQVKKS